MKSTAMSGVKQFLKPDAYKQSERQRLEIRDRIDPISGIRSLGDGVPFV